LILEGYTRYSIVNLTLNTPEPVDFFSWTSQTQLRRSWEALECQLSQCAKSDNTDSFATPWVWPLLLSLLKVVAAVLLVVVGFLLIYQIGQGLNRWLQRTPRTRPLNWVEPVRSRLDWLEIAQDAQARQDYHKAFEALYKALLVQLHESGVLRQDVARTDGEYIRGLDQLWSLGDKPLHLREDWVTLFRTHESFCFGAVVIQQPHFDKCRAAYDSLAPYLEMSPDRV
jgi:hypothetical protein